MTSRWLTLVLSIALLCPVVLRAQVERNQLDQFDPFKPNAADSTSYKMYEDIEIFRRILDRKLEPLYPTYTYKTFGMVGMQGGMGGLGGIADMRGGMGIAGDMRGGIAGLGGIGGIAGMPGGMGIAGEFSTVRKPLKSLEGVYLKAQGVVYTATLASLQPPAKAETSGLVKELKIVRPDSEWESIRRQLRKEKEEPKKPEASKPPTLSDVLLTAMAENGHHFSQLGESEGLTLVLTMHETGPSAASNKPTHAPAKSASQPASGGQKREISANPSSQIPHSSNFARDWELLGDLHLKHGRYEEALREYKKLMKLHPKAEVFRKTAQCYLALEKYEEARTALDRAIRLTKEATQSKPAPAAKPASTPLPVKLIISAPKKLLDQVKEGKITFAEFRAKVHVETLRFDDHRSPK